MAERRQVLESKRNALFSRLKKLESQANYKACEAKALQTILKGKIRPNVRALRRKLNILEFKIETESTSLQIERQLMKEIKKTEKEIEDTMTEERQFRKLAYLESDVKELEAEMKKVEQELQETINELSEFERQAREEHRQKIKEERIKKSIEFHEKKRKETQEKIKQENEPYMSKLEPTVSLEDICVIRKKEEKKDDE